MEGGGGAGEDLPVDLPVPALPGLAARFTPMEGGERLMVLRARAGIGLGLEAAGGSGVYAIYEIPYSTRQGKKCLSNAP